MWYKSAIMLCLALAACGRQEVFKKAQVYDMAEPAAAGAATVQAPQIAYSYRLSYLLGEEQLADVQTQQVALCNGLGAAVCRVVRTTIRKGSDGADGVGETSLLVAANTAIPFQKRLDAIATQAGGEVSDRSTTAEDVTKDVIDTDARVRAKQALADRLMKLIAQSDGKVADLVAAEQAFATTQEELDAARSLQASLRQRVAMSAVDITYATHESSGLWAPVRRSFGTVGESFAGSIAALVTFTVIALPWAAVLWLLIWGLRRLGMRWPFRRRNRVDSPG